jgi:hypothetical protein
MKEKYRKFEGSKSYGNNFYEALWNKGIFPNNSYEIPMDWPIVMEFWRKQNMSSNLIVFFPMLFLHCFQRHQNPIGLEVLGHFNPTFFLSLSFVNPLFQRGPYMYKIVNDRRLATYTKAIFRETIFIYIKIPLNFLLTFLDVKSI